MNIGIVIKTSPKGSKIILNKGFFNIIYKQGRHLLIDTKNHTTEQDAEQSLKIAKKW